MPVVYRTLADQINRRDQQILDELRCDETLSPANLLCAIIYSQTEMQQSGTPLGDNQQDAKTRRQIAYILARLQDTSTSDDELRELVEELQANVTALTASVSQHEIRLDQMDAEELVQEELVAEMQAAIDNLEANITTIQAGLEALQATSTAMGTTLADHDSRLESAESSIVSLEGDLDELLGIVEGVITDATALDTRVTALETATTTTITADIANLQGRMTVMEDWTYLLQGRIMDLESKTNQQGWDILYNKRMHAARVLTEGPLFEYVLKPTAGTNINPAGYTRILNFTDNTTIKYPGPSFMHPQLSHFTNPFIVGSDANSIIKINIAGIRDFLNGQATLVSLANQTGADLPADMFMIMYDITLYTQFDYNGTSNITELAMYVQRGDSVTFSAENVIGVATNGYTVANGTTQQYNRPLTVHATIPYTNLPAATIEAFSIWVHNPNNGYTGTVYTRHPHGYIKIRAKLAQKHPELLP